jgi:hypothetical protein
MELSDLEFGGGWEMLTPTTMVGPPNSNPNGFGARVLLMPPNFALSLTHTFAQYCAFHCMYRHCNCTLVSSPK